MIYNPKKWYTCPEFSGNSTQSSSTPMVFMILQEILGEEAEVIHVQSGSTNMEAGQPASPCGLAT